MSSFDSWALHPVCLIRDNSTKYSTGDMNHVIDIARGYGMSWSMGDSFTLAYCRKGEERDRKTGVVSPQYVKVERRGVIRIVHPNDLPYTDIERIAFIGSGKYVLPEVVIRQLWGKLHWRNPPSKTATGADLPPVRIFDRHEEPIKRRSREEVRLERLEKANADRNHLFYEFSRRFGRNFDSVRVSEYKRFYDSIAKNEAEVLKLGGAAFEHKIPTIVELERIAKVVCEVWDIKSEEPG